MTAGPTDEGHPPIVGSTPRQVPASILTSLAVGAGAFAMYALTASPFVGCDDVAEFQTLGASPGIAHAGYPLLTLALEAAHRLPFGTAAYRANLVSALGGAMAVGLAVHSMSRYAASRLAAAIAGIALALAYSLWHESTQAEVYAFTLPLAAGAYLALAAFHERRRLPVLFLAFLLVGFGLTAHLGSLAIACVAGAYLAVQSVRRGLPRGALAVAALGLACGLLPFVLTLARDDPARPMNYIEWTFDPWSGAHVPWAPDPGTRLHRLAVLLSGRQFLDAGWFHPFKDTLLRARLLGLGVVLNDLPGPGTLLALFGAALAVHRRRTRDLLLLGWLAATLAWAGFGAYPMVLSGFFLPGLWVLAHFAALALAGLRRRRWAFGLLGVALLAAAIARPLVSDPPPGLAGRPLLASVWNRFPREWSPFVHDSSWDRYGRELLAGMPPRGAVLFCWEEGTVLMYFRHAERVRTDLLLKPACRNAARLAAAIVQANAEGRAVYSTISPHALGDERRWVPVRTWPRGGLWRLESTAGTEGRSAFPGATGTAKPSADAPPSRPTGAR